MVFQQIKVLFLTIIGVLRKALCCFSRRNRKPSESDPLETLQIVVENNNYTPAQRQHNQHPERDRDWNSWDDSPRTVEEHIEQYRQRIAKPRNSQSEEGEPDFFSELAPVIQPQTKFYLGDDGKEKTDFSRLEAKSDVPIAISAELEDWEDGDPGGWEELDTEQTKQMIREKRREMRNQRQKSSGHDANGIVVTRLKESPPHRINHT